MVIGIPGNQLGGGKKDSAILFTEGRNPIFVPHVWGKMVLNNGSKQWL